MIISDSGAKDFRRCQRYAAYLREFGVAPYGAPRFTPLLLGKSVHKGLQRWYEGQGVEGAVAGAVGLYREAVGYDRLWEPQKEWADAELAYLEKVMRAYASRYPTETFVVPVAPEIYFITILGDTCRGCNRPYHRDQIMGTALPPYCECGRENHYVRGIIDLIIRYLSDGKLVVVDHKWTTKPSQYFFTRQLMSPQLRLYVWAANRLLQEPVTRAMVNVLVQLKKVDERGNPFKRTEVYEYRQSDLDEVVSSLRDTAEQWAAERDRYRSGRDSFPRNLNACVSYDICPYVGLCLEAPNFQGIPPTLAGEYRRFEVERHLDLPHVHYTGEDVVGDTD